VIIASVGPSPLWYLTRASGAVTLVLLTGAIVLGISNVTRIKAPGWPRFVVEGLHRNVSLLAVAVLLVHIVTTVLDPFGSISVVNAVIPFTGTYRPLWLGLGAFASDLLLAIAITSLVRRRLGHKAWRATHWFAYLCWPLAVVHGLGTGSDVRQLWLLALTVACAAAVLLSLWARIGYGWPARRGLRIAAAAVSLIAPVAVAVWVRSGPLGSNWAARAGTPLALLVHSTGGGAQTGGGGTDGPIPTGPFNATLTGSFTESQATSGVAEVNISASSSNTTLSALNVRIYGTPIAGGGLSMSSSAVSFGSGANPTRFQGNVTALSGQEIRARVTASDGTVLALDIVLSLDPQTGSVTGTLAANRI